MARQKEAKERKEALKGAICRAKRVLGGVSKSSGRRGRESRYPVHEAPAVSGGPTRKSRRIATRTRPGCSWTSPSRLPRHTRGTSGTAY